MELFISILMFFGLLSPEQATTMSDAELNAVVSANQQVIEQAMDSNDPQAGAALEFIIDRRED